MSLHDASSNNPLAAIEAMDRAKCIDQWRRLFGDRDFRKMSIPFMRRVLLYEAQNKVFGRLTPSVTRVLVAVASGKKVETSVRSNLRPGSHLVREWNGRSYQVAVLVDGFEMDGKRFKSLSAIATKITGTKWSGPRFFGLTKRSLNGTEAEQGTRT